MHTTAAMAPRRPAAKEGPTPFDDSAYDFTLLPDYDNDMVNEDDFLEFAKALAGGEPSHSTNDASSNSSSLFIRALNDWRPVYQKARRNLEGARTRPARALCILYSNGRYS